MQAYLKNKRNYLKNFFFQMMSGSANYLKYCWSKKLRNCHITCHNDYGHSYTCKKNGIKMIHLIICQSEHIYKIMWNLKYKIVSPIFFLVVANFFSRNHFFNALKNEKFWILYVCNWDMFQIQIQIQNTLLFRWT